MEPLAVIKSKRKRSIDTNGWRTPKPLFKWLSKKWVIVADVAASAENNLCEIYFTKQENALFISWSNELDVEKSPFVFFAFCNPPYERDQLKDWLEKAYIEMNMGLGVIMLLPYTGQLYWKELVVERASKIYMIYGRLPYGHPETGIPYTKCNFTSAIVVFDPRGKMSGDLTEWISQDLWNKL